MLKLVTFLQFSQNSLELKATMLPSICHTFQLVLTFHASNAPINMIHEILILIFPLNTCNYNLHITLTYLTLTSVILYNKAAVDGKHFIKFRLSLVWVILKTNEAMHLQSRWTMVERCQIGCSSTAGEVWTVCELMASVCYSGKPPPHLALQAVHSILVTPELPLLSIVSNLSFFVMHSFSFYCWAFPLSRKRVFIFEKGDFFSKS